MFSPPRLKSPGPKAQHQPRKLTKPNPARRAQQSAASSNDSFVIVSEETAQLRPDAGHARRRSESDCRQSSFRRPLPDSALAGSNDGVSIPSSVHRRLEQPVIRVPRVIEGKETRFHEHFSESGSDTTSTYSKRSRPRAKSAAPALPAALASERLKPGKEGSAFVERFSIASGSVRADPYAHSPLPVTAQPRATSPQFEPTPLLPLPQKSSPPTRSPVRSSLRPKSLSRPKSPLGPTPLPKNNSSSTRRRLTDIRSSLDHGPEPPAELMGISAPQWRHSSSPPPEGYEYIPADEQGTAEDFMEGFLLNPNSIRPIKKPPVD